MEKNTVTKKKLIYRSANRGWKETDLILGKFTKHYIDSMDEDDLKMFDLFLNEPDSDIFEWITQKKPIPSKYNNKLIALLLNFDYAQN